MVIEKNTNSPFRKVSPVRIFEQAVEQIRELVDEGLIKPGEKLPTEQDLSRQLNVSRSSIREALRVLEADGFIEIRRGQGAFVSIEPNKKQNLTDLAYWLHQREETLEQVLQVRGSIEGLTAMLFTQKATQDDIEMVRSLIEKQSKQIEEMVANGTEDYDVLAELDAEFHLYISKASGNDIACEIISHIVPAFNESNKAVLYVSKRMRKMEQEHKAILDAIETGDPAAAEQAMRFHLVRVMKEIIALQSEQQPDQEEEI